MLQLFVYKSVSPTGVSPSLALNSLRRGARSLKLISPMADMDVSCLSAP